MAGPRAHHEELSRFSKADADAYRRLLAEYDEVKHIFGAATFTPPGFGPSLDERLAEHPPGGIWLRRAMMSAWDVIRREFESRARPGVHPLAGLPDARPGRRARLRAARLLDRLRPPARASWTLPRGGSGALTDALVRCIEDRGGTVLCERRVSRLVLEDGRCAGVETEAGERFLARERRRLDDPRQAPGRHGAGRGWGEDFGYGVETFDVGVPWRRYLATTEPPVFETPDGPRSAVSAGLSGWPQDVIDYGRALRDGRWTDDAAVAARGHADAGRLARARGPPHGEVPQRQLVRRAVRGAREARSPPARARAAVCPEFTDDVDPREARQEPEDIEAANEHMIHGTFHGGDRTLPQSGALRPVPGWAQHRMPIPGLYQTGGTTHPGGSITGAPGRNAAIGAPAGPGN